MEKFDKQTSWICLALAGITFFVYQSVTSCGFVNYDDPVYVTQNSAVLSGISWNGIIWAFTAIHASNWHPVTWLSHMMDVQLFGMDPGWHHFTNLLFHVANTLLLFLLLKKITGAIWRSAFVAGVFALHPLHVESVAWISERKDVLSTFFFLLTLWTYSTFAQSRIRNSKFQIRNYLLAIFFFALGLMSKPMLVTTPFVLLLLDFWPLCRMRIREFKSILIEKFPFVLMSLISIFITLSAQKRTIMSFEGLPLPFRLSNAVFSYARYFKKTIFPSKLAVFYPYPEVWNLILIFAVLLFLIGVTSLAIWKARKKPYLAVGWFWFLGTLVPVIGLVQAGLQSSADRYTYIPIIGLGIIFSWGLFDLANRFAAWQRQAVIVIATSWLASCAIISNIQLQYWRNSQVLFEHAISVTSRNAIAHYNLAVSFLEKGQPDEAKKHLLTAEIFKPQYPEIQNNLANILSLEGKLEEAVVHYEAALRSRPEHPAAHYNLGVTLAELGENEQAIFHFREALRLQPQLPFVRKDLALALSERDATNEALQLITQYVGQNPNDPDGRISFGKILLSDGDTENARSQFDLASQLKPNLIGEYLQSAKTLLAQRKVYSAIKPFEFALLLDPNNIELHKGFGEALAKTHRLKEAQKQFNFVLKVEPTDARANYYQGLILVLQSQNERAIPFLRQALLVETNWATPKNDLAWILATDPNPRIRNGSEAVKLAQSAWDLSNNTETRFLGTLDAALAETSEFEKAIQTAEQVRTLALARGEIALADAARERLACYKSGKPFRQIPNR